MFNTIKRGLNKLVPSSEHSSILVAGELGWTKLWEFPLIYLFYSLLSQLNSMFTWISSMNIIENWNLECQQQLLALPALQRCLDLYRGQDKWWSVGCVAAQLLASSCLYFYRLVLLRHRRNDQLTRLGLLVSNLATTRPSKLIFGFCQSLFHSIIVFVNKCNPD